jgi:hypothetical protein
MPSFQGLMFFGLIAIAPFIAALLTGIRLVVNQIDKINEVDKPFVTVAITVLTIILIALIMR